MRFSRMVCFVVVLLLLTTILPISTNASSITLNSGSHIRWIDRIGDLPEYGWRFYAWLESNAGDDGALVDPSKGLCVNGEYVYRLDVLMGSVTVGASNSSDQVQTAVMKTVNDQVQRIMDYAFEVYGAFDRDHPEVFWLSGKSRCGMSMEYSHNKSTGVVSYDISVYFYLKNADFDIRSEQYSSVSVIRSAIAQREMDIDRILAECPMNQGVAEQIRYLNRVLTHINGYNSLVTSGGAVPDSAWKCVSALSGRYGAEGPVCEGYARAFKVLCDRLHIPCVLTEGQARNDLSSASQLHMWNYVQIDEKWYAVDVTWNDPVAADCQQQALSGHEREAYLLIGSSTKVSGDQIFSTTHQVLNNISSQGVSYTNGPKLNGSAYIFKMSDVDPEPRPDPEPDLVPEVPAPGIIVEYLSFSPYRNGIYTAPEKAGYVFVGWYTDVGLTDPLDTNVTDGCAYAGFVSSDVLQVKCQLGLGCEANSTSVDLRLLTGVASLNISAVVFWLDGNQAYAATGLYEQLSYDQLSARSLFGPMATYVATATICDIAAEHFDEIMTVTPSWYTLDGTFVTGTPRRLCISDGLS